MLKKILKIISVLIVITAVGLGVYWFFDRQQGGDFASRGGDGLSIRDFFPFGGGDSASPSGNQPTNSAATASSTLDVLTTPPRLWRISNEPQSGAVIFNASNTPIVRFVDKATGNIFESRLRLLGVKRISNTTIPKVYEAMWQPNGDSVVLRYLGDDETVKSVYGKLASGTPLATETADKSIQELQVQELQTVFLPENIINLSVNPATGAFVYVLESPNGSRILVTNPAGTDSRQIFESAIRDFSVRWINNATVALLGKPSAAATGQFYFIKTDSGRVERIMGGQNGLSALASPDGTKIAYTEIVGSFLPSGLFNPKTGEKNTAIIRIIPEKCVWSGKSPYLYCAIPKNGLTGEYPDRWYQGKFSFNDTLWRINSETGASEFLINPPMETEESEIGGVEIDAVNLMLDPNEEYLVFTNKKDSRLWGLKISEGS